jgi:mycothiol system anti-sigma-R factor
MQCEKVKANLDAYVSGETSGWIGVELESHLEECLSCAGLFETRKRVKSMLWHAVKKDSAPSGLSDRIRKQIRRIAHAGGI